MRLILNKKLCVIKRIKIDFKKYVNVYIGVKINAGGIL